MVIEKNYFFFRTLRVVLDNERLREALAARRHTYITGLSYDGSLGGTEIRINAKKTPVIDCAGKSDEDFLRGANDTTRNEIRRTFKTPELSFAVPDQNRMAIWQMYAEFERAGGRSPRGFSYFNESLFAGAYYNGALVAAIICYDGKPYLRAHAIVSLRKIETELKKYISFATRRLVFELAKFGREGRYAWLDLGGVNLQDEAKAGIDAFKLSFGARLVDEYTYMYAGRLFRFFGWFVKKHFANAGDELCKTLY